MIAFEKVVIKEKPDLILVYGDTNTTLSGALVAAKLKITLAHVEAGMRMLPHDMPEEINRVLADRISQYLFCPSETAVSNLKSEGIVKGVHNVGDVMCDLFMKLKDKFKYDTFKALNLKEGEFILMSLHRDYNVDIKESLDVIMKNIDKIGQKIQVVFTMHPRTKKRVAEFGLTEYLKNITVIEPTDYLNLMGLLNMSQQVITDSGGLQKEAYFAKKRSVVLMPDTGWRELIERNLNVLSNGSDLYEHVFNHDEMYNHCEGIYGNGKAGKKIVEILTG